MVTTEPTTGGVAGNPTTPTIICIEAAAFDVRPDHALNAVGLEIVDQSGAGFACLLGPVTAAELIDRLNAALVALLGDVDRLVEAQRLLRVLLRVGLEQRAIAERLGLAESTISHWATGRSAPRPARLADLRRLVVAMLRAV